MLETLLPIEVFAFSLVFTRIATMFMLLPALGEASIPTRMRVALAFLISVSIFGLVKNSLPVIPNSPLELFFLVFYEIAVGLFIAGGIRLLMTSLNVAGSLISFQGGLTVAQVFDPSQGSQTAMVASFLTLVGITVIFTADLHHLLLKAMYDSYALFPPNAPLAVGDFAEMALQTVAGSFRLGLQMAAPFIVYGLVFYTGLGLVARLMPQLQVFFVAMPLNVFMGFLILMLVLSSLIMWFLDYFTVGLSVFLR